MPKEIITEGRREKLFTIVRNKTNRNSKLKDAGDLQLFSYIRKYCKQKGLYTRPSGLMSTCHFDLKLATLNPEMLTRIYYSFEKILKEKKDRIGVIGSVGGLEVGAVPLITFISKELMVPSFFIRKESCKDNAKKIEGIVQFPVLLVEDVINTGASFEYVLHTLRSQYGEYKTKVAAKLAVLDRRNDVYDYDFGEIISLFKESDFE